MAAGSRVGLSVVGICVGYELTGSFEGEVEEGGFVGCNVGLVEVGK